ncbi:glycoside hydrolase family 24 protein [Lasiosphaeria miniovina]|uniref:Glycoside hydrolase family 24 protein n=1 Tax=Lasiosphaeria miniovina TaxID=1954250 RepID=A0AA40DVT6_9PEZI|nr:glycoside hydrolase family 24 protein [Lasiosphaeria miniovina]KAK0713583.1 glycoside hydrolase family 24 protein [Lasiosphaeria miniovina]
MKLTVLAGLAPFVVLGGAYPIIGDVVNCRSGPGTSYDVKRTYKEGQDVKLTCQTPGEVINGVKLWDKTTDGCYVSDYYVKTGTSDYVASKCGSSSGSCAAPRSNQATVDLISEFEGFRASVYTDPTGNPTVGYGHLCSNSKCSDVKYSIPLSKTDGKKLLADDMRPKEDCITKMTSDEVTLNLNQYGALVSWAFNMGCGAAEDSSLIKRLNKGENPNALITDELPKWVHGGGEVLPGLVRRRDAEVALAKTATTAKALPVKC